MSHLPQGQFLFSLLSFSAPTFLVLVAMSVWLTVLAAYWALAAKVNYINRYSHRKWRSTVYVYKKAHIGFFQSTIKLRPISLCCAKL